MLIMLILMIAVVLLYGVLFFACCLASATVYRKYARDSKLAAFGLSLLCITLPVLFLPIPEHGGMSFVFVHVYDELLSRWERSNALFPDFAERSQSSTFTAKQKSRFRGSVEFTTTRQLSDNWREVVVAKQTSAWYDAAHKLVWSDWIKLPESIGRPSLDIAEVFCSVHPPQGYWALANEAENSLLWKTGGENLLPKTSLSTVSYIPDDALHMELPTYQLRRSATAQGQTAANTGFAVRCVALADGAPAGGYSQKDIPLEDWNGYQLQKLAH